MSAEGVPIDIHSGKLLDWLLSRRHCGKEWRRAALDARRRVAEALGDMPEDGRIVKLLDGADDIDYFACVRIVDVLKDTERDSKNVFGYYSSRRMKDWQEILRVYAADGAYVAEAAAALHRLAHYDVPAARRRIARCGQICEESAKKSAEHLAGGREHLRSFTAGCTRMGVPAPSLDCDSLDTAGVEAALGRALAAAAADDSAPPAAWRDMDDRLAALRGPTAYYRAFAAAGRPALSATLAPLLRLATSRPRATVYEWRHGGAQPTALAPVNLAAEALARYDRRRCDATDDGQEQLDLDLDPTDDAGVDLNLELDGEEAALDFGIETLGDDDDGAADVGKAADCIARGDEALLLYEHEATGRLLAADIDELSTFLRCRLREADAMGGVRALDQPLRAHFDASAAGHNTTAALLDEDGRPVDREPPGHELQRWLESARQLKAALADAGARHWVRIRTRPGYLESLCADLMRPMLALARCRRAVDVMARRGAEAQADAKRGTEELGRLARRAKALQAQIESDISGRYGGRPVRIIGGVHAALADFADA